MLSSQIVVMLILFLCAFSRPLVLRPVARMRRAGDTAYFIGMWMCIGACLMLPLFKAEVLAALKVSPFIWMLSFMKGILLWCTIVLMQKIRAESSSTAEFRGMMTVGVLACVNVFLGEALSLVEWLSVAALFILGALFIWKGHLSKLHKRYKGMFAALVLISALPGVTDHLVLTEVHWYVHFSLSGFGIWLTSVCFNRDRMPMRARLADKHAMVAGCVWLVSEAIILSLLVTYIPVTLGVVSMTMSVPLTMLVSALSWGEGRWQEQAFIGGLSYLAVLPIVLM